MKFLLLSNAAQRAVQGADAIAAALRGRGQTVLIPEELSAETPAGSTAPEDLCALAAEADVIVAVGGDGTILRAAKVAAQCGKPLLGVNAGRVGFLAVIEADEFDKLDRVVAGDFTLERRNLLAVTHQNGAEPVMQIAARGCGVAKITMAFAPGVLFVPVRGSAAVRAFGNAPAGINLDYIIGVIGVFVGDLHLGFQIAVSKFGSVCTP